MSLIIAIRDFLHMQSALLAAFHHNFPNCKDMKLLLDFPRSGEVGCRGEIWSFHRHGVGLLFENQSSNCVIDVHRAIECTEIFDAWRLEIYLESIGKRLSREDLVQNLNQLVEERQIARASEPEQSYFLL